MTKPNPRRRRGDGASASGDINANIAGSSNNGNSFNNNSIVNGGPRRERNARNGGRSSSSSCWTYKRLVIFLSLIVAGIVLMIVYYKSLGDNFDDLDDILDSFEFEEEDNRTASQVLSAIVEASNDLILFEMQLNDFLVGQRLANLLKEKLQSVQARVTSLTTQTSQYEKMDYISGGPTHFISTSIQELEAIEENQLATLDEQVTVIIAEETLSAVRMGESVQKLFEKSSWILEAMDHHALLEENINIYPNDELEEKLDTILPKFSLLQILPIVAELADKLELKELASEKLRHVRESLGLMESFDALNIDEEEAISILKKEVETHVELSDAVQLFEWRIEEAESFIEEHELELQLVLPLHSKLMSNVSNLEDELLHYATNKRRAYLNLRHTLAEDVRKLKVRIQNLKYKYAKYKYAPS